ncbi:MAG: hypothetical protein Q4E66_08845, partial [Comamonadaceae bacterium]|nr:hypothetical protein [Comamonadaceae bacterium]
MHLRFCVPRHLCLKTALIAALSLVAPWSMAGSNSKQPITQAALQARLQEAQGNPELGQRLYSL